MEASRRDEVEGLFIRNKYFYCLFPVLLPLARRYNLIKNKNNLIIICDIINLP